MTSIDPNIIKELKSLSDDKFFFSNLVDVFSSELPDLVNKIIKAHEIKDGKTLGSLVHKCKSSTRQLGALTLSNYCLEVEKLAKSDKHTDPKIQEYISKIQKESIQAIKELRIIQDKFNKE